jgi:exo-beta-1,3-glucanase (GH17 family)
MADATASPTMGVNFSNLFMSNPVAPAIAATQIAALPVMHAKTFSYQNADLQFIQAAASKNLRLAVGIPNDQLQALANGQTQGLINAIRPYANSIELLCVGNEPLGDWYHGAYLNLLVPAMQHVQTALKQANLRIGVTVPLNYSIMANSYPPSAGQLDSKLTMIINNACGVMAATGAPFMINVYPFLDYRNNRAQIPLPYCLFTATQSQWVHDGSYTYKNIFDASLDALYVAMGKIGRANFPVIVGECGWPTQGDPAATVDNAQTFNQNLITHCKSGTGTPRRSGQIRCYVFEMYDENLKSTGPGPFEVAWGVYNTNLRSKYALNW